MDERWGRPQSFVGLRFEPSVAEFPTELDLRLTRSLSFSNSRFEKLRPPVAPPWQKDRGRKMGKGNLFYFSAPIFLPGVVSQAASPAQTENC
jgi:hypothetical protein